jgi:hypothetical protein
MTVNTHLVNLASDLVLSSTEKESITTSINTLSLRLDSYFGSDIREFFSSVKIVPREFEPNWKYSLMSLPKYESRRSDNVLIDVMIFKF